MSDMLRKLASKLGLNSATSAALISRIWSFISGPVTLLLIVHCLSPQEQGYLSIFESLLAVRCFVELGLSTVIMQFVSHERGSIEISRQHGIVGLAGERSKIASLFKIATCWYAGLSILLGFILAYCGKLYFSKSVGSAEHINWQAPVLLLSVNASLSLLMQPFFGILEGMAKITEYFVVGMLSTVFISIALWVALSSKFGLLASPVSAFIGLIPGFVCIWRWRRVFLDLLRTSVPVGEGVRWFRDIFPLQVRIAVTSALGYFIFNLMLPIVFDTLGSVPAGQLGQTLRFPAMILGMSNVWIITRFALYGRMISQNAKQDLVQHFRKGLFSAVAVAIGASLLLAALLYLAANLNAILGSHIPDSLRQVVKTIEKVPHRLASPSAILALLLNAIISAFVYGLQSLVRAHRKEPFIVNAIIAAVTVPLIAYFGAVMFGVEGVSWGMCLRTLVIEVPLTIWVFNRNSCITFRNIFARELSTPSEQN
jgi:hypothetical protein